MSIFRWLGLVDDEATAGVDSVAEIEKAMTDLDPARARFLACFAYLLGRVARADHHISENESEMMVRIMVEHGHLPREQAALAIRIAQLEGQRHGGTEDFLVSRQFAEAADREQRLALLECLFIVSAADESIRTIEDNEIRKIVNELKLEHADFVAARSRHARNLEFLRRPQKP